MNKRPKLTPYNDKGVLVTQNMSSGIIISTHSLVLQSVTRRQSGEYSCVASNSRGERSSKPVHLRVRYSPVCKEEEVTVIGASLDEVLKVRCQVSADPGEVTFVWQFNNSGESFDVSPARFATSSGNVSELMYTPASQRDYGTLTCWGRNSIGRQQEPCVFQVVPAAKPGPPTNCTLRAPVNRSSEILDVECRPGYDGGLPQSFLLEAFDANNMKLRLNLTSSSQEFPLFRLDLSDLPPWDGSPPALRLVIYAQNAKGKGEKVVLEDIMLNDAEKRTDGGANITMLPMAALLTGSLLTLGLGVFVIVVVTVKRRHRHCGGSHCALQLDPKQPKPPAPGSMLEINTGDNRYVVAYTVKQNPDCQMGAQLTVCTSSGTNDIRQPDILNTPRDLFTLEIIPLQ
ncbi:hypothetical protein HHI36_000329 [Cryptolaemus montrouzieri]|uniref:Ig-like domain-containing protein n=1 Tax=Cryptolaemus montrouzieri TaxID=559131 RepID=A0ABD2P518_9CUCU